MSLLPPLFAVLTRKSKNRNTNEWHGGNYYRSSFPPRILFGTTTDSLSEAGQNSRKVQRSTRTAKQMYQYCRVPWAYSFAYSIDLLRVLFLHCTSVNSTQYSLHDTVRVLYCTYICPPLFSNMYCRLSHRVLLCPLSYAVHRAISRQMTT